MAGLFHGSPRPPLQSNKEEQLSAFVTPTRLGTIKPIPIDYGFRPRLRGRLTLRGLTLRTNPWTYSETVTNSLSRYSFSHFPFPYLHQCSHHIPTRLRNRSLLRSHPDT